MKLVPLKLYSFILKGVIKIFAKKDLMTDFVKWASYKIMEMILIKLGSLQLKRNNLDASLILNLKKNMNMNLNSGNLRPNFSSKTSNG